MNRNLDERFTYIAAYGFVLDKGRAWFYNYTYGAIFEIELKSGDIDLVWMANDSTFWYMNQYGGGVLYDNRIVFAPRNTNKIMVLDLMNRTSSFIEIDDDKALGEKAGNRFIDARVVDENIYFFPGRYKAIVKLNMKSLEITYYEEWYQMLGEPECTDKVIFPVVNEEKKGVFLLPCWQSGKMVRFDSYNLTCSVIKIGNSYLADICFLNNNLWVAYKSEQYIERFSVLSAEKNSTYTINDYDALGEYGCRHIFCIGELIYIVPFCGNAIVLLDSKTGNVVSKIPLPKEFDEYMKHISGIDRNTFAMKQGNDGAILLYECRHGELYYFNSKGNLSILSMRLPQHLIEEIRNNAMKIVRNDINYERVDMHLSEYLRLI